MIKKTYSEIAKQNIIHKKTEKLELPEAILFEFYTHQIVWDIKTQKYDEDGLFKISLVVSKKKESEKDITQIIIYNKNENTITLLINGFMEHYIIDHTRRTIQYKFKEKNKYIIYSYVNYTIPKLLTNNNIYDKYKYKNDLKNE